MFFSFSAFIDDAVFSDDQFTFFEKEDAIYKIAMFVYRVVHHLEAKSVRQQLRTSPIRVVQGFWTVLLPDLLCNFINTLIC